MVFSQRWAPWNQMPADTEDLLYPSPSFNIYQQFVSLQILDFTVGLCSDKPTLSWDIVAQKSI
jgi:hypothetical protein